MPIYVGIDFGSTNTRVASTENLEQILRITKFQTSPDLVKQQNKLAESILEVCEGNMPDFIGVGIHGLVNKKAKKFIKMPNYSILDGKGFEELFSSVYPSSKLIVENDAVCGALGESHFGAGQDFSRVVYITLSTGVGGALVVDGSVDQTASYEPGHHIINFDGRNIDGRKIPGEFEAFCSGTSFKDVYGVESEDCIDPKVWTEYGRYLSYGVHNLIQVWSPEVIVIGGGLGFNHFEKYKESLDENLKEMEFTKLPEIRKGELGDDAGVYGVFVQLNKALAVSQ